MKKAVILLHGFLTNVEDFGELPNFLNKFYDRVVLEPILGHTIPPNYREFNARKVLEQVLAMYDSIKDEYDYIDVIGFSMGGALATYLQAKRKIRRIVLLAAANKYLNFKLIQNRLVYQKIILSQHDDKAMKALRQDDRKSVEIGFKNLFFHYSIHNIANFIKLIDLVNLELQEISSDCLILWGKLDQLVPLESANFLYDIARKYRKKIIYEDISHLMLRSTNYQKIIREILNFLCDEHLREE